MPAFAIRFENLTLGYRRHPAVHHLSADIPCGALVAVVGPNGAGKSTLLRGVAGELRPLDGHIRLPAGRAALAYMSQKSELDSSFPVSVFDMAAMGLWREIGALGRIQPQHRARVGAALQAVGLSAFGERTLDSLSGGQLQRLRFARLILQNAPLILLDEPFAAIDMATVEHLMQVILSWHEERRTVLVVVHDHALVRRYFPTSLMLARELVAFGPTDAVMTEALIERSRALSEAFDESARECAVDEGGK